LPLLRVENLVKVYGGGVTALRGVSFTVERGEVFGLVGPNGAGKSTTFKIIATLLKPTSGSVVLDGIDIVREPFEARKRLAFVPEEVGGYRRLTGLEYLEFVIGAHMAARGAGEAEVREAVREAARIAGLDFYVLSTVRMGEYSKGMKRRVQIAWALAVKPKLAILDEPTTGLDVEAAYEIRRMIKSYSKEHGVTVLLSSHNMFEVQYLCDRVALIKNGRIIDIGSPAELMEKYSASNLEEAYIRAISRLKGG
jgi:ABC-2 type transport system ATP-binding protein